MKTTSNASPLECIEYTPHIKERFSELIFHFSDNVSKVKDPKMKTLFNVSAKALARLQKAFINYEERIKKLETDNKQVLSF